MKVLDIQQYFTHLSQLLDATGGRQVAIELRMIVNGMGPFQEYSLKDFSDFLVRAEGFSRGEVPVIPKKQAPLQRKSTVSIDVEGIAAELKVLYDRAASDSVTTEHIRSAVDRLSSIKKGELLKIAESVDVSGSKKTVPQLIQAIQRNIEGRKGSAVRVGLIDRY